MHNTLICIIFFLLAFSFTAQNKIDIKGKVKAKIINQNSGNLLVSTSKATYGINPKEKELLWKSKKLKKVVFPTYLELGETALVLLEKKPLINSKFLSKLLNTKGASFIIINSETGAHSYDSAKLGYKSIYNLEFFPRDNSILFTGIKRKSLYLCRLNLSDKSKNWEIKLADNKFIKAARRQLLNSDYLIRNQKGSIFWVFDNTLSVINADNGQVISEFKNVNHIKYEPNNDVLISFKENINITKANKETSILAYQSDTMNLIWDKPVKIFGKIKNSILSDGKLIVITQTGFNIIDIKTGDKLWKKSDNLPLIETVIPTQDQKYLIIQGQYLLKIDNEGHKVWKNPVKIFKSDDAGIYFIKSKDNILMSITPSFIHKINSKTGELIWDKPKTLNTSTYAERSFKLFNNNYRVWIDKKEDGFLIFSNTNLYRIRIGDTLKPRLIHTFKEKEVPRYERKSNGYFFHQNSNFIYLNEAFSKVYDTTLTKMMKPSLLNSTASLGKQGYNIYKATLGFIPKQIDHAFKSALVTTNAGIFSSSSAFVYGNYHNYTTLYSDLTSLPKFDVGSYLEDAFKTLKKDKRDNNTYLFVTSEEDISHFYSLDKKTGEIIKLISLEVKSKDILIDQNVKVAYIFYKDKIEIFDLKQN